MSTMVLKWFGRIPKWSGWFPNWSLWLIWQSILRIDPDVYESFLSISEWSISMTVLHGLVKNGDLRTKVLSTSFVLPLSCSLLVCLKSARTEQEQMQSAHCGAYIIQIWIWIIQTLIFLNLLKPTIHPSKSNKANFAIDWLIVLKLNIQFIIMRTFQTSNKSNFAMSFWMIRWNLAAIKQLAEMEYFHSSLPMKIASN